MSIQVLPQRVSPWVNEFAERMVALGVMAAFVQREEDLTEEEKVALCIAAGVPLDFEMTSRTTFTYRTSGKVGFCKPSPTEPWVVYHLPKERL